jgi:hypothetical protein
MGCEDKDEAWSRVRKRVVRKGKARRKGKKGSIRGMVKMREWYSCMIMCLDRPSGRCSDID